MLSKSTRRIDKRQKMRIYAREGVRYVWQMDPLASTLDTSRSRGATGSSSIPSSGDESVRAEPFEAIELELALVWSR